MTVIYPPSLTKKQEIAMPEANNQDTGFYILIGIIGFFLLIGLLFGLAQFLNDFMSELRYLNNEIGRTDG